MSSVFDPEAPTPVEVILRVQPDIPKGAGDHEEYDDAALVPGKNESGESDGHEAVINVEGRGSFSFSFPQCFWGSEGSQKDVYGGVGKPLVSSVMRGCNASLIAYGPTGTGKSYSLFGRAFLELLQNDIKAADSDTDDDTVSNSSTTTKKPDGIFFSMLSSLLRKIGGENSLNSPASAKGGHAADSILMPEHGVGLSIYAVGAQELRDLGKNPQALRLAADGKGSYRVVGLKPAPISTVQESVAVVEAALRRIPESERSMTTVVYEVEVSAKVGNARHRSRLVTVDMAGCDERDGGLELTKSIQLSSMTLGTCLEDVTRNHRKGNGGENVPHFRNCALTKVLRSCVGIRDARCALLLTASPEASAAATTLQTLKFGERASGVKSRHTQVPHRARMKALFGAVTSAERVLEHRTRLQWNAFFKEEAALRQAIVHAARSDVIMMQRWMMRTLLETVRMQRASKNLELANWIKKPAHLEPESPQRGRPPQRGGSFEVQHSSPFKPRAPPSSTRHESNPRRKVTASSSPAKKTAAPSASPKPVKRTPAATKVAAKSPLPKRRKSVDPKKVNDAESYARELITRKETTDYALLCAELAKLNVAAIEEAHKANAGSPLWSEAASPAAIDSPRAAPAPISNVEIGSPVMTDEDEPPAPAPKESPKKKDKKDKKDKADKKDKKDKKEKKSADAKSPEKKSPKKDKKAKEEPAQRRLSAKEHLAEVEKRMAILNKAEEIQRKRSISNSVSTNASRRPSRENSNIPKPPPVAVSTAAAAAAAKKKKPAAPTPKKAAPVSSSPGKKKPVGGKTTATAKPAAKPKEPTREDMLKDGRLFKIVTPLGAKGAVQWQFENTTTDAEFALEFRFDHGADIKPLKGAERTKDNGIGFTCVVMPFTTLDFIKGNVGAYRMTMRIRSVSSDDERSVKARRAKAKKDGKAETPAKLDIDWNGIRNKLPVAKTVADKERRRAMFDGFDPNGNGYLSLAEIDKGVRDILGLDGVFDCKPVIMRAYQASKNAKASKSELGDDYVERREFRLLLIYLRQYFEVWQMFDLVDSSHDRRVEFAEFEKAVPQIAKWGVEIADAEAAFNEIDANGGGVVLFDEFADWALRKRLDLEDDDDFDFDGELAKDDVAPPPEPEVVPAEAPVSALPAADSVSRTPSISRSATPVQQRAPSTPPRSPSPPTAMDESLDESVRSVPAMAKPPSPPGVVADSVREEADAAAHAAAMDAKVAPAGRLRPGNDGYDAYYDEVDSRRTSYDSRDSRTWYRSRPAGGETAAAAPAPAAPAGGGRPDSREWVYDSDRDSYDSRDSQTWYRRRRDSEPYGSAKKTYTPSRSITPDVAPPPPVAAAPPADEMVAEDVDDEIAEEVFDGAVKREEPQRYRGPPSTMYEERDMVPDPPKQPQSIRHPTPPAVQKSPTPPVQPRTPTPPAPVHQQRSPTPVSEVDVPPYAAAVRTPTPPAGGSRPESFTRPQVSKSPSPPPAAAPAAPPPVAAPPVQQSSEPSWLDDDDDTVVPAAAPATAPPAQTTTTSSINDENYEVEYEDDFEDAVDEA